MLLQQRQVLALVFGGLDRGSAVDDPATAPIDERPPVVPDLVRQTSSARAIQLCAVDLQIPLERAREHHEPAARVDGGLGNVLLEVEHTLHLAACEFPTVQAELRVHHPDIAFAEVEWLLRARVLLVGRTEVHVPHVGREVAARRSSKARAGKRLPAPVGVHHDDLLVGPFGLARLVHDLRPIEVPIGLRVLAPEGELADVSKVDLLRMRGDGA